MDILLDLADRLNFTFEIEVVKDKTFGKKNEKGEWNGIIGELVNRVCTPHSLLQYHRILLFQRADLGLAGLTITYQREQVIPRLIKPLSMIYISGHRFY